MFRYIQRFSSLPRLCSGSIHEMLKGRLGFLSRLVLATILVLPAMVMGQSFIVLSGGSGGGDAVYFTAASGVSNRGVVVGDGAPRNGFLWELEPKSTFVWREGSGFEVIFKPDDIGLQYVLQGVSSDGSTVVGSFGIANFRIATAQIVGSESMIKVNDPDVSPASSEAFAANYDGERVAGSTRVAIDGNIHGRSFYDQAWLWSEAGGTVLLGYLAEASLAIRQSEALAISADGATVVGYSNTSASGGFEAFRWSAESGMLGLGDFLGGPVNSLANDISASGNAIVGYGETANGIEAALWLKGESIRNLGTTNDGYRMEVANATSVDGSIVVGQGRISEDSRAMIWDEENGLHLISDWVETNLPEVDLQGWKLREAIDISDNGRYIIGRGVNLSDDDGSWRLDLGSRAWNDRYSSTVSEDLTLEFVQQGAETDSLRIVPDDTRESILESSSDLRSWNELEELFLFQGLAREVQIDKLGSESTIYYRLRPPE